MITLSEIINEPLLLIIQMLMAMAGLFIFPTKSQISSKFKRQSDHDEDIKELKKQNKENLEEVKKDIKEHISLGMENITGRLDRMDELQGRFNTVGAILDAIKEKG